MFALLPGAPIDLSKQNVILFKSKVLEPASSSGAHALIRLRSHPCGAHFQVPDGRFGAVPQARHRAPPEICPSAGAFPGFRGGRQPG
jgi:hypothetical protein